MTPKTITVREVKRRLAKAIRRSLAGCNILDGDPEIVVERDLFDPQIVNAWIPMRTNQFRSFTFEEYDEPIGCRR